MDYNTRRKKLVLPEYGRNIQMMVDYVTSIEDREERNRAANTIIAVMGNLNPHLRDINDFKHKLWDHIAIISDFNLDIDFPYEIPRKELFMEKPNQLPYNSGRIRFRHYGRTAEKMVQKAVEMPDGEEKEALIKIIANQMKKSYLTWSRDTVDDSVILNDIEVLSKGRLTVDKEMKLVEVKEVGANIQKKKSDYSKNHRHGGHHNHRHNHKRR